PAALTRMAQGTHHIDIQVLHDLRQKFPEVPEGVVSQCVLQNNNNLDACCEYLSQVSPVYLYSEEGNLSFSDGHAPSRLRNHMTQLNLGLPSQNVHVAPSRDSLRMNGSRTLSHSLSEGPLPSGGAGGDFLQPEPQSAPVQLHPGLGVFGPAEPPRKPQPPQHLGLLPPGVKASSGAAQPAPRFNPITVTLAPNIQTVRNTPTSLHIHGGPQSGLSSPLGNSIYIRPFVSQSGSSRLSQQQGGRAQYSPTSQPQAQQQTFQISQPPSLAGSWAAPPAQLLAYLSAARTRATRPPTSTCPSARPPTPRPPPSFPRAARPPPRVCSSSTSRTYPPAPARTRSRSSWSRPSVSSSSTSTAVAARQQRLPLLLLLLLLSLFLLSGGAHRSSFHWGCGSEPQPAHRLHLGQPPPLPPAPPARTGRWPRPAPARSPSSTFLPTPPTMRGGPATPPPSTSQLTPPVQGPPGPRNMAGQVSMGPAYIHHHPPKSRSSVGAGGTASPRVVVTQPNTKYTFKITVSPNKPPAVSPGVVSPTFEPNNLLGLPPEHHRVEPEPLHLSDPLSPRRERPPSQGRRLSTGSEDAAYTQALLVHQKARMERLWHELELKKKKLEKLKEEVNEMENDLSRRRLERSTSTSQIPSVEDMKQLRCRNRLLLIDIDCLTKEIDLLQTRGPHFNPGAIHSFYDNIGFLGPAPPKPRVTPPDVGGGVVKAAPEQQQEEEEEGAQWSCTACTFLNHPALNRCEKCEFPRL
ncbi:unnamed protein product, partial [Tetraodon nigroviridis]